MDELTMMTPNNNNLDQQAGFWDQVIPTTNHLKYIMPQVLRYTQYYKTDYIHLTDHKPSHAHYMQGQEDLCGIGVCPGRRGSHGRGILWLMVFDSDLV
ncbi:hypothetical protein BT69DRAFT_1284179 [Atractiella rhizophila]|nr:hypothetical protein BT69DRAFT_1284179 [Atractiella rhizophila]